MTRLITAVAAATLAICASDRAEAQFDRMATPAAPHSVHETVDGTDLAAGASKGWQEWTLVGVGLAATLMVTVVLTRAARARMRLTDAAPDPMRSPAP